MRRRFRQYLLLTAAAAFTAYGLTAWHDSGLSMEGLLLFDNGWRPHPLHVLVLGISMLPPAMWDIFWHDTQQQAAEAERHTGSTGDGSQSSDAGPQRASDGA